MSSVSSVRTVKRWDGKYAAFSEAVRPRIERRDLDYLDARIGRISGEHAA
jgi:hypothetical protein